MVRAATFLRKNGRQRLTSLTRAATVDIQSITLTTSLYEENFDFREKNSIIFQSIYFYLLID